MNTSPTMVPFLSCFLLLFAGAVQGQNNPFYRTKVGDFDVVVLSDGTTLSSLEELAVNAPVPALANALSSYFLPTNFTSNYSPVYVDTGFNKILFDVGSAQLFGPTLGKLLENMAKAGLDPNQVDSVVITHAHVDHIGGVMKPDGSLAFPNARYYMSRVEHDFWVGTSLESEAFQAYLLPDDIKKLILDTAKDSIGKMGNRLELFEFGEEIIPGVTSKKSVGHSPGHSAYILKSGDESFFIAGDSIIYDHISVDRPEWQLFFDMDSPTSIKTRFELLEELAESGMRGAYFHFDFPGIGHVYRTPGGFAFRHAPYEFQ